MINAIFDADKKEVILYKEQDILFLDYYLFTIKNNYFGTLKYDKNIRDIKLYTPYLIRQLYSATTLKEVNKIIEEYSDVLYNGTN